MHWGKHGFKEKVSGLYGIFQIAVSNIGSFQRQHSLVPGRRTAVSNTPLSKDALADQGLLPASTSSLEKPNTEAGIPGIGFHPLGRRSGGRAEYQEHRSV
jgi:hypothetical protein